MTDTPGVEAPANDGSHQEPLSPPTPSLADGAIRQLDPRSISLARIVGAITAAILSLLLLVPSTVLALALPLPLWGRMMFFVLWLLLAGLLVWWKLSWPKKSYRHASYKLDEVGIEIRRGVLWRRVIHVPRSRVQHTDVAQGPLERSYGLGTLSIFTAGTDHAQVHLSGLAHETALAIRDLLLPREGGDAV